MTNDKCGREDAPQIPEASPFRQSEYRLVHCVVHAVALVQESMENEPTVVFVQLPRGMQQEHEQVAASDVCIIMAASKSRSTISLCIFYCNSMHRQHGYLFVRYLMLGDGFKVADVGKEE